MGSFAPHRFSDCAAAQRTKVYREVGALSLAEIDTLTCAARAVRDQGHATLCRVQDHGEYRTTWLQAAPLAPCVEGIVQKLIRVMQAADRAAGWQLLDGGFGVRCVEFHENACDKSDDDAKSCVTTGAPTPEHYDAGSLVTLDIMLSATSAFAGGAFGTLEADGTITTPRFEQGDAICFVSHKYHCVTPVRAGTREVLVIELWRGPQRRCPHRCLQPTGECTYTNNVHDDDDDPQADELLPAVVLDDASEEGVA